MHMHATSFPGRSTQRAPRQRMRTRALGLLLASCMLAIAQLLTASCVAAVTDMECQAIADVVVADFADGNADAVNDCDAPGAENYVTCGMTGVAGGCASNAACPNDPELNSRVDGCTATTEDSCCMQIKSSACASCGGSTFGCIETCEVYSGEAQPASSAPAPPLSTTDDYEFDDATCAEVSDLVLEALAEEDPANAATSCTGADAYTTCDSDGSAGTCSSDPTCSGIRVVVGSECTSAADDSGCCVVLHAKTCSTCGTTPLFCYQFCLSPDSRAALSISGSEEVSPAAGGGVEVTTVTPERSADYDEPGSSFGPGPVFAGTPLQDVNAAAGGTRVSSGNSISHGVLCAATAAFTAAASLNLLGNLFQVSL